MDRIDMHIEVPRISKLAHLSKNNDMSVENSGQVRSRVECIRKKQMQRAKKCNAQMSVGEIDQYCSLGIEESHFLSQSIEKLNLSSRAYHRILKVARTIADMQDEADIELPHIAEAIGFRRLDRS
jgi:magnesium chelatase family protein